MKKIINASELQRKGLKDVYKIIEKYGQAIIINQRNDKKLLLFDQSNPYLLINIIKNLKAIKEKLKKEFLVDKIALFGSFARGTNNINSDLDILISTRKTDLHDLFEIEDFIEENLKISKIDLFTTNTISAIVFENIKKDLIYV